MSEITSEISVKLRLAVKKKISNLKIEYDPDLVDFILLLFAQKKRFAQLTEDLRDLVEVQTEELCLWVDDLTRKVNDLNEDEHAETYRERKRLAEKQRLIQIESSDEESDSEETKHPPNSDSDSGDDSDANNSDRSRSRSRSPQRNRINIFLDDTRRLHDLESERKELQKRARKLNKDFAKNSALKDKKSIGKEYQLINIHLEKLLIKCDGVNLDQKDDSNRKYRKNIIKDIQNLLERNDKSLSFL